MLNNVERLNLIFINHLLHMVYFYTDVIGLILRRLVDCSPEKNQEDLQPCFRDNEEDSPKSLGVGGRNAPDS